MTRRTLFRSLLAAPVAAVLPLPALAAPVVAPVTSMELPSPPLVRAIVYVKREGLGQSVHAQLDDSYRYAYRHGYVVVATVIEEPNRANGWLQVLDTFLFDEADIIIQGSLLV